MIKVLIGGVECDFDTTSQILLSFKSSDLADLESGRTGKTIELRIPLTAENSEIFGIVGDVHPQAKFNEEWHSMEILADEVLLFSGTAYLMNVLWEESKRYAVVECRGGVVDWVTKAAATRFNSIELDFEMLLNEVNIKESWESDSPVKFFPITRDRYEPQGSSSDITGVRKLRTIDDYHPFIKLTALIEAIVGSAGYSVDSSLSDNEEFEGLYVSGSYSSYDNSAAQEAMGFYVKREEDCTTQTDSLGRVSLSPYTLYSTVGNFVDLATTTSDNECYNHGNVLQADNKALIFRPLTQLSVGFEYFLHYTCDCSIESRTKLKGIDTLDTIGNGLISWEITNRYLDQRDDIRANIEYKVIIFDFEPGERYQLMHLSQFGSVDLSVPINERMTSILFNKSFDSIVLTKYNGVAYLPCQEDWALYFGYTNETCTVEVEVAVRTPPEKYSPTSPKQFEFELLRGADAGVDFTLHKDSSVRPYFAQFPGYNSLVKFKDIGQHSFSALAMLEAIQHLYNLRFSTNEEAKVVTIESFDDFYTAKQWDWTSKLLLSEKVEFSDYAHTTHRSTTYGYQQTDGVVKRLGEEDNIFFGEWEVEVDSYAAAPSKLSRLNPILCASTNDEDGVLVVGDRDDIASVDSLNFSPRIARYFGMREVDRENYSLPYISFHAPEEGFTLCFENRDGAAGLNRFYQSEVELLRRSQRVSVTLKLTVLEYSNLFNSNEFSPSLRDRFYFEIQGESFVTSLYSVESYDPSTGRACCTFLTLD